MFGYASLSTVLLSMGCSLLLGPPVVSAASLPTVDLGYAIYQAKLADVRNLNILRHLERITDKLFFVYRLPETRRLTTTLATFATQLLQSGSSDLPRPLSQ
jgi:hypothetical protein